MVSILHTIFDENDEERDFPISPVIEYWTPYLW